MLKTLDDPLVGGERELGTVALDISIKSLKTPLGSSQ